MFAYLNYGLLYSSMRKPEEQKWACFLAVGIGTFVLILDQSSVNIALPQISSHFRVRISEVQWVVIGYGLTTGALMIPIGRFSDIFGKKAIYFLGFVISAVGSLFAGTSPSLGILVISRSIQGMGGAMIQANAMAILITVFPLHKRSFVIGVYMTIIGVASVIGPVYGGVVVQQLGWRWLLLITIPLTVFSALYAYKVLPEFPSDRTSEAGQSSFDLKGSILFSALMAFIMIIMTNGHRFGWFSIQITLALLISIFLGILFTMSQIKASFPLIDLQLLKRKYFALGSLSGFFTFLSGTAVFFMMPFYLQGVLGYSPSNAGLIMMPMAGCFALSGPISGWLSDHYGWRKIEITGLLCVSISLFLLSFITTQSKVEGLLPLLGFLGLGMGLFYSPNSASILSVVERDRYSLGTSFINVTRNYASIVGISLTTAVITTVMGSLGYEASLDAVKEAGSSHGVRTAFVEGLNSAFRVQVVLTALAVILTALKGRVSADQHTFGENSG